MIKFPRTSDASKTGPYFIAYGERAFGRGTLRRGTVRRGAFRRWDTSPLGRFAVRTVCRLDSLPSGQYAVQTFRRWDISPYFCRNGTLRRIFAVIKIFAVMVLFLLFEIIFIYYLPSTTIILLIICKFLCFRTI